VLFRELLGQVFADGQAVPDRHLAGQQHRHPAGGEKRAILLAVSGWSSRMRTSVNGMPNATAATHGRIDHDE
jgi:hypothetical protein